MTPQRTCLRCDWQGETDGSACPDCAAPLYGLGKPPPDGAGAEVRSHPEERSREAASTAIVAPSSAPPRPSSPPPPLSADAVEATTTRSRSLVGIVVAVIVLAVAVGSWLNAHEAPTEVAAPRTPQTHPPPLTGALVYAVPDGTGHSRLWRYDLETQTATPGPRVRRAIELIDARSVDHAWLGLTSELPNGHVQASILRSIRPDARPIPVLEGDVVSWGPQGRTVTAGRRGALGVGCERSVSVVWARVNPPLRERKYADPSLCGDLLSIGSDNLRTMFTLDRNGHVGIFVAGIGRIHRLLDGYAMVAVSGLSDQIVVPQASLASLRPLPSRPEQERADLLGAGLYVEGSSDGRPLPYVNGPFRFAIARVLAWSPNGSYALVVGSEGFKRGFYLLDTVAGDGLDAPRYVGPVLGVPYGTITLNDVVIVETGEGVFRWTGGDLVRIQTPAVTPPPDGPIVWIP
jgi:hypothetical protein